MEMYNLGFDRRIDLVKGNLIYQFNIFILY